MLTVKLPNGNSQSYSYPATPRDVAETIGPRLAKDAVAAEIDGKTVGLDTRLPDEGEVGVRILTVQDAAALDVMRHSAAHIMARAVMTLFPDVQLAFGPTIQNGFYYDFQLEHALTEADFPAIEAEMARIIAADEPFERIERPRAESLAVVENLGQRFKVEHIQSELSEHDSLSFYRQGEFIDLCRGPHLTRPAKIVAFKLLSVAGAYWKGDADRDHLQRLYGTAFFTQKDLDEHLTRLEEAKRRDHRELGKKLDLFTISPLVGQGLILWMPKGAVIRGTLEQFLREELRLRGYSPVYTPNIGRVELYERSGHFPYYADSQFKPIDMGDGERYLLKPMNCPHHIMIFKSRPRTYRDLPLRLAEFGTVYRYEQSGELSGMTRVRGFCQDDAHIFCTDEQVGEEFRACIEMTQFVLNCLGLTNYRVRLGFRDPKSNKYVGDAANWDRAENALIKVCEQLGIEATAEPGEAAFYGPKADFVVTDCLGREWQLGTVQLDYNLPSAERFDLEYIGANNAPERVVMIHRAPLGSFERFVGVLIEHFAGAFPLWLAPEQVRILPVSEKSEAYARAIEAELIRAGMRVTGDYRAEKLGSRIRDAQLELIPYMIVVGPRDAEAGTVSVRDRIDGDLGAMSLAEAVIKFQTEIAERQVRQTFSSEVALSDRQARNEY